MRATDILHKERIILDEAVSLEDAEAIIAHRLQVDLHQDAVLRCAQAHERLQRVINEERHVYGLTTGFGPLANRLIDHKDGAALQQNLVYHLASGVGPVLSWQSARAMVLARLMSILQGASGASDRAIKALVSILNSPLAPSVPSQGTVGASGDLTPLAHMVLCLQGQGAFFDAAGVVMEGQAGLDQLGIAPLDLAQRDGLALVNGTSAMTGVAVLNAVQADRAVAWSIALTAVMAEVQSARTEAWHPAFAELRPHKGQDDAARLLRAALRGSTRVERRHLADRILTDVARDTEARAGQDAYTLRCAPQVIGAVRDLLDWHQQVVHTELNAVTDNPIFPPQNEDALLVLHGGNFMGQHVALASDALSNGLLTLANLAERQIARVTDEKLNGGLPAFLHQGQAGLHSGFMGAQVTATALLAEMRTTGPASTQSISTNGANQDVVSMGTIAARLAHAKLLTLSQIQAIMALVVVQAMDILMKDDSGLCFSENAHRVRDFVRNISAEVEADRPLGRDIEAVANAIANNAPPAVPG